MNPLQKAWLIVLRPVVSLVNDKLAKKSGILGRIGKFYSFGPRQFGFHPINRMIAHFNHSYVSFLGFTLHRYSLVKFLSSYAGVSPRMDSISADPLVCTPFLVLSWPSTASS
jgi:hypothetical protein